MKPVAIVGRGNFPLGGAKIDLRGKEVWGMNVGAMRIPSTVAFQMHKPDMFISLKDQITLLPEYLKWLKELTIPVYMRETHPEFPTSVSYPFDEVFEMTKHVKQGVKKFEELKFLTSTVSQAIALAILQGKEQIDVYGVELERGTEYEQQRDGYCFWIGFAAGRGIDLNIYCGDGIFKRPIYGS